MKTSDKFTRLTIIGLSILFFSSCASSDSPNALKRKSIIKKSVAATTNSEERAFVPVATPPRRLTSGKTIMKGKKPFVVKFKEPSREDIAEEEKPTEKVFSLHFREIGLDQIINMLSDRGKNFRYIIHPDVGDRRVLGLVLENVTWKEALNTVLSLHDLMMDEKHGLLIINTYENFVSNQRRISERIKLRQEQEEMERSILTASLDSRKMKEEKERGFRTFRLKYTQPDEVKEYLNSIFSAAESASGSSTSADKFSGITFSSFAKASLLTAYGTPNQLFEVAKRIDEIDQPQKQIFIESRIVEIIRTYSKSLGVQWGGSILQRGNPGIAISSSSSLVDSIDGSTLSTTNTNESFTSAVNLGASDPTGQGNAPSALSIAISSLLGTQQLNMRLSALEQKGRSRTLSNPKITTINGVTAKIESGREIPYNSSSDSGTTTVAFKKAVLSLEVTPFITPNDMVNMEIKATKDDADFINQVGGVPSILSRNLETNVLVASGGTAVLGGVFENTETNTGKGVPGLSNIPILGWLFKNHEEIDDEKELLIFITPTIVRGNFS